MNTAVTTTKIPKGKDRIPKGDIEAYIRKTVFSSGSVLFLILLIRKSLSVIKYE